MIKPVVCIGAALVDELYYVPHTMLLATTNVATVQQNAGGVSRNLAHQLALLGLPVELISVFGSDSSGTWLADVCRKAGIGLTASVFAPAGSTGKYTGIINKDGSLFTAFLTGESERLITPAHLLQHETILASASFLLADANLSVETVEWLVAFSRKTGVPLIIEPASVPPAQKLQQADLNGVYIITPNEDELPVLCSASAETTEQQVQELLKRGVQNILLHAGAHGSVMYSNEKTLSLHAPDVMILDCTGAGDGSLAGWILGKCLGKSDIECLQIGHTLAGEILQVKGAIAPHINQEELLNRVPKYYAPVLAE